MTRYTNTVNQWSIKSQISWLRDKLGKVAFQEIGGMRF